ncbi:MAG TPA: alpha/beta hydrolase [Verrucomicrobiae bacterium]|nr:alpha/beta hydrolase [Verrucomicrobiae bacterium]
MKIAGVWTASFGLALVLGTGCMAPIGARMAPPAITYRQLHVNALNRKEPTPDTHTILLRYNQQEIFEKNPDAALQVIHQKAVESKDRSEIFALAELNYLAAERISRSVKPWEPRDARDYYLASAVYAYFFLFGETDQPRPDGFDLRFRVACELYNNGLGLALTKPKSKNAEAMLAGGQRKLPVGSLPVELSTSQLPWKLEEFESFLLANQFLVRGLSVRNRRDGVGAPLIAVMHKNDRSGLKRCAPVTAFLRIEGSMADLDQGRCRATLECYSAFATNAVTIGERTVPLEADTTAPMAYGLNQQMVWEIEKLQFLSAEEKVPSDVYLTQPYEKGKVPVVFVHGTFSSPVWWAEMANTLKADEELTRHCQIWYFIYNSGNPVAYSADRLRAALADRIKELDPEGKDPALQHMVLIGHSQGGLLTKLTATDTGDKLLRVVTTNRIDELGLSPDQQKLLQQLTVYEALPFVKCTVFIATPHRGSFLAGSFVRNLARRFITLPNKLVDAGQQLVQIRDKLKLPREFRGQIPTSIDSMSPKNKFLLTLADIPTAPGVSAHSIIAVKGSGDYHDGNDGVVEYKSAHIDYARSEFIVRSGHSCQSQPPTIEEVRRILYEHVAKLPANAKAGPTAN